MPVIPITTSSFDIVNQFVVIQDLVESVFLVIMSKFPEQIGLRAEGQGKRYIHGTAHSGHFELDLCAHE